MELATSKMKVTVTLLLLCALILPITEVVIGQRSRPNPPPPRPNPPSVAPNPPRPQPPINQPPSQPPVVNQPTVRPPIPQPTAQIPIMQPTIQQPTIRPTVSLPTMSFTRSFDTSFSFTRSLPTSFSFTRSSDTSFSFSRSFSFTFTTTTYWNDWWYTQGGYWYPGMGFFSYAPDYNYNTGSFTLDRVLTDQDGRACLYYEYFQFDAPEGLSANAKVWSDGQQVVYLILPQSVLTNYEKPETCGANKPKIIDDILQAQQFGSTPISMDWTSPADDQYVIVFISRDNGSVYFVPQ